MASATHGIRLDCTPTEAIEWASAARATLKAAMERRLAEGIVLRAVSEHDAACLWPDDLSATRTPALSPNRSRLGETRQDTIEIAMFPRGDHWLVLPPAHRADDARLLLDINSPITAREYGYRCGDQPAHVSAKEWSARSRAWEAALEELASETGSHLTLCVNASMPDDSALDSVEIDHQARVRAIIRSAIMRECVAADPARAIRALAIAEASVDDPCNEDTIAFIADSIEPIDVSALRLPPEPRPLPEAVVTFARGAIDSWTLSTAA